MKNRWTDIEIKKAIDLHNQGLTFEEIANELIRTTKAIKEKLGNLGYKQNHKNLYEEIICTTCGKIFTSLISENRKFCSSKCSATYNNKIRPRKIINDRKNKIRRERYYKKKTQHCLNCGNLVFDKFCNNTCFNEYKTKQIFKKIENNEVINIGNNSTIHRWYKKYLIFIHGEKCMECGWREKNPITKKVPIEIEHIDGNSENNSLTNLKLLCPNCHSLTPTYRALNTGNGRYKRRERYKNGKSY